MLSLQTVLPDTLELLKTLTQMPELENIRLVEPYFFSITLNSTMMKRLFMTLLMLVCFLSISWAQICRDKSNMQIGKIESNGVVRNSSNMKIGSFDRNNTIRNASNMKVGSIDNNGVIRDRSNMKIGTIDKDGIVRDATNMRMGTIEKNGTVRDKSNMKVGSAENVNPQYAAVFFFFFHLFR